MHQTNKRTSKNKIHIHRRKKQYTQMEKLNVIVSESREMIVLLPFNTDQPDNGAQKKYVAIF